MQYFPQVILKSIGKSAKIIIFKNPNICLKFPVIFPRFSRNFSKNFQKYSSNPP